MLSSRSRRWALASGAVLLSLVALYALAGYLVAPRLARDALVERARQAGLDLRLGRVAVNPFLLSLEASDVRVALGDGRPLFQAQRAGVDLGWASLWRRDWVVDAVAIAGGTLTLPEAPRLVDVQANGQGREFTALARLGGGRVRTHGRFSLEPPGVSGTLELADAPLAEAWRYLPASSGPAPEGRLGGSLQYHYAGGRLALRQARAQATLASGGRLALRGAIALSPFAADLRLEGERVPLALLQPWLRDKPSLRVAGGTASAQGRLRLGEHAGYQGSAALEDVRVEDAQGALLVAWQRVATGTLALDFSPFALRAGEVLASAPHVQAVIARDGGLNLARAMGGNAAGNVAANGAAGGAAPRVFVERLRIENGRLDFADRSLDSPFATTAEDLAGAVTRLAAGSNEASDEPARIELAGRVGRYGEARVRGMLDLDAPASRTSLSLRFRNLALADFTPYVAKFAGYRIDSGRLSAELRYRVREGRLVGDNRLAFDRLRLGEKVASASALDLPLDLAVALLTDAHGRIDLAIPVRGDLRDPQVDLGGLIAQAVRNTLGRLVSAPFRVLASLFGGEGERLDEVRFEPGSASLAPPEEETLARLARALAERPGVSLSIRAGYDARADREALQRGEMLRELAERAGYRAGAGSGAPSGVDARDPKIVHAAERLYVQRGGKTGDLAELKPRERGYGRRLLDVLAQRTAVGEDAVQALARTRAQAVADALVKQGVAAGRLSLAPPVTAEADERGVSASLALDVH